MFIKLQNGQAVEIISPRDVSNAVLRKDDWLHMSDIMSEEQAIKIAEELTETTGKQHIHSVRENCSPKFTVFAVPAVGDEVSGKFNGDSNPCGVIVKVSKTFRIVTSTGHKFNRVGKTPSWKEVNGYRNLIQGHHNERNAEF